jgi:hypothetical protein
VRRTANKRAKSTIAAKVITRCSDSRFGITRCCVQEFGKTRQKRLKSFE